MNMKGDTLYAEGSRMRCFLKKLSNKHGQDKASFRKVKSKCLLHVSFVIGLVWNFKICISILWFEILKYKHTFFCYTLARSTFSLRLLQLLRKMCKLGKVQIETFYNLLLQTKLSKIWNIIQHLPALMRQYCGLEACRRSCQLSLVADISDLHHGQPSSGWGLV